MGIRQRRFGIGAAIAAGLVSLVSHAGVTVLHGFDYSDGQYPNGPVLLGQDGRVYGTANWGGAYGYGVAFAVSLDKTYSIVHSFNGADGQQLDSGLIQRTDGTIFGSTPQGTTQVGNVSTSFGGTLFSMTGSGAGFNTLHMFAGNGLPDGAQPGKLLDGGDGYLYGVTRSGGANGLGTVFKAAPDGTLTTLYTFSAASGGYPDGQLTAGSDGYLYGALTYAPNNNNGALFRISRGGAFKLMHTFAGLDGTRPSGGMAELAGAMYGVTVSGGPNGSGTVFRMSLDGNLTLLRGFNGYDGYEPVGPLALGPDGNFYGLTFGGGLGSGTIFRISPKGSFMTLHMLAAPEGINPFSGPVMDANGMLYGAASGSGGAPGASGAVFSFDALNPQPAALAMDKHCYNEFDMCFDPINTWVGQRYSITWGSANLSSCVAGGAWKGVKPTGGHLDVTATRPGIFNYKLTCTGPAGIKSTNVSVTVG